MSQPATEPTQTGQAAPPPSAPASPVPAAPAATPPAAPTAPVARVGDANAFSVEAALRGISETLTALPERLVNGVREAGQAAPPPPVVNTPQPSNSPPAAGQAVNQPAKRRTFGEWWFGKS
jgi:hypothetical protein